MLFCFAHYRFLLLVFVAFWLFAPVGVAEDLANSHARVAAVRSVYDGDTFRADIGGLAWSDPLGVPIRVAGIDTPEIKGQCEDEVKRAIAARDTARALLKAGRVIELTNMRYGYYGRVVADVWIDGVSLGGELLRRGLARRYLSGFKPSWC